MLAKMRTAQLNKGNRQTLAQSDAHDNASSDDQDLIVRDRVSSSDNQEDNSTTFRYVDDFDDRSNSILRPR